MRPSAGGKLSLSETRLANTLRILLQIKANAEEIIGVNRTVREIAGTFAVDKRVAFFKVVFGRRALARREALANRLEPPQGHQRRTRSKRPKQEEDL